MGRRKKRKRGIILNLEIVVNANPEVEQFSIHDPQDPFSIAKDRSSAAASQNDEAIAQLASGKASKNEAEAYQNDEGAAQLASGEENSNENAAHNDNNHPLKAQGKKRGKKKRARRRKIRRVIEL